MNHKNPTYYSFDINIDNELTEERLKQLSSLGCKEVGFGEFGINGVFSGLYLEKVWNYTEVEWNEYIKWFSLRLR